LGLTTEGVWLVESRSRVAFVSGTQGSVIPGLLLLDESYLEIEGEVNSAFNRLGVASAHRFHELATWLVANTLTGQTGGWKTRALDWYLQFPDGVAESIRDVVRAATFDKKIPQIARQRANARMRSAEKRAERVG
jgi:hypothetical protein